MATSIEVSSDGFVSKFRNMTEDDKQVVYNNALHALNSHDVSVDGITSLRQLHHLLFFSKFHHRVPADLIHALVRVVTQGQASSHEAPKAGGGNQTDTLQHGIILLAAAILQDLSPTDLVIDENFKVVTQSHNVQPLLSVVLGQGRRQGHLQKLVHQMVKWVSTAGFEPEVQYSALHCIVNSAMLHRELLSEDQLFVVSSQVGDWLSKTSTEQEQNPNSKKKTNKQEQVLEIDGTSCDDVFTILSLSQYFSPEQLMNIHAFSVLRCWLQATFMEDPVTEGSSEVTELSTGKGSITSSGKFAKKAKVTFLDKACEYCLRVLDQCSRKPLKPQDQELIQACLVEVVSTLELLCRLDSTLVPKLFPAIKTFHSNLISDGSRQPRALLAIIQFFLHFSEQVVFNAQEAFDDFFLHTISILYSEHSFAFDVTSFIVDNLETLCYRTLILEKYFPSILKILAWNPRTFLADFLEILPAMTSPTTTLELFHALVDLPCTTAALEVSQRVQLASINPTLLDIKADWKQSVDIFKNPNNRPWFNFVLRSEAGQGDTINRLDFLYHLLNSMSKNARVMYCAEAVPVLLRVFFATVLENADLELLSKLVPALFERTALIYDTGKMKTQVQNILSEELLEIFKHHPGLIVDKQADLLECLSSPKNIEEREGFCVNLIWLIGEYASPANDSRCSMEVLIQFYEALEALLYEISMTFQSSAVGQCPFSLRLVTTIMGTAAKLASRCQDLIPRVILCITKISQQLTKSQASEEELAVVSSRAKELVNLLKFPDVAGTILNPTRDMLSGLQHRDTHSSSILVMRAASELIPQ